MRFTYRRLLLAATIAAVVSIPAAAGGQAPAQQKKVSANHTAQQGAHCPRGTVTLREYRSYARKVYRRDRVSRRAHRKLAYSLKCQAGKWGRKMAPRYHRRFKREREARRAAAAVPAHLRAIAQCESGGNPRAISKGGKYRGKYQFDHRTWQSVGGSGDPAAAPEAEQDRRAKMLYARRGAQPWPVCGA